MTAEAAVLLGALRSCCFHPGAHFDVCASTGTLGLTVRAGVRVRVRVRVKVRVRVGVGVGIRANQARTATTSTTFQTVLVMPLMGFVIDVTIRSAR